MFGFLKKERDSDTSGYFHRLAQGLKKTRSGLFGGLKAVFTSGAGLDEAQLEEIESRLLMADLGIEATNQIMEGISSLRKSDKLQSEEDFMHCLYEQMSDMLKPVETPLIIDDSAGKPAVILVVGVNGVGKTTTIGKLSKHMQEQGRNVLLAAGDTFRAAAIEQLQSWGSKNKVPVIAQQHGSDSAAVIFDALQSAAARNCDLVIADTAGRLHNKDNLMEELKKIRRSISKFNPEIPVEVLLVIDAGTGQNAISQTKFFNEAIGVSGIVLTKLDGTARGGVVFALAKTFDIPVRFIGIGEQVDDLRPFQAGSFVAALLDMEE